MTDWMIVMAAMSAAEIKKSSVYRHLYSEGETLRIVTREIVHRPLKHNYKKRYYLQRLMRLDNIIEHDRPDSQGKGPCYNCKNRFKCASERLACDDFNEYVIYGRLMKTAARMFPNRSYYMANFPHDPFNNRLEYDHKLMRTSPLKNRVYFNPEYVPVLYPSKGQGV